MGDVSVVIPWRAGCAARLIDLGWVLDRYQRFPDIQIRISEHADGPWCKAQAIRRAVPGAADILVIADADCWTEGIGDAVEAVREGASWAVPHQKVHRLTQDATSSLIAGRVTTPLEQLPTLQPPYRGTAGGGMVVIRREVIEDVPPDTRFTGWGAEDGAWRDALRTLVGMEHREGRAALIHLWHPPQERRGRHQASPENAALARSYVKARNDTEAMRELVDAG